MSQSCNWRCPFCGRHQTVVSENRRIDVARISPRSHFGSDAAIVTSIACANPDCLELTLDAYLSADQERGWRRVGDADLSWHLRPNSLEVPQPDFIPTPLRQDYYEACRIRDLSPEARATIAWRCLQGMIRDFCGITTRTLFDEIVELRARVEAGQAPRGVSHDTMDAIDHVRSLGNIGAHMEKDINLIVDIDADEAQQLIGLLELLFEEWHMRAEARRQRWPKLASLPPRRKRSPSRRSWHRRRLAINEKGRPRGAARSPARISALHRIEGNAHACPYCHGAR
jgi:hypothetical protein